MNNDNIYSPPSADLGSQSYSEVSIPLRDLASRWARLGASIIDAIILLAPYFAFFYLTDGWDEAINKNFSLGEQALWLFAGLIQYLVLNGYLLHKRGQSIGKWALGIKIVSYKDGEILPLWKVFFIRYVPQVLVSVIPFIGSILIVINDLFIFRKDKRCVHDLIAGTKVIKSSNHNKALQPDLPPATRALGR